MRTGYMSSRQSDFSAFRTQLAPMRAARARLAGAKNLHSLESLAAGWLPIELLRELASLPLKRMRWLPLPLVNQQAWPQLGSQSPGCGWPLIHLAGIFCLSSGTLLRAAHGCWKTSEARLFALLRRTLRAGDILVADRGFWSFANLAFLPMRGIDFLVRGRYAKRIDWRKGQRIGKDDRLITMKRPADKDASRVMSARLWKSLPATITVRQVRVQITRPGFRTHPLLLITTLLDPVLWPMETLASLYPKNVIGERVRCGGADMRWDFLPEGTEVSRRAGIRLRAGAGRAIFHPASGGRCGSKAGSSVPRRSIAPRWRGSGPRCC